MSIWLVMQGPNGMERRFSLQKPRVVIGREATCDVRIPVPSVSQKHCQITFDGAELKLADLNSDKGTYHNGQRVQEAELGPEDTLTIGPVTFVVRVQADAAAANGHPPEIVIERQNELNGHRATTGNDGYAGSIEG